MNAWEENGSEDFNVPTPSFYVGIILAVLSSIFIGVSFIIKKKALLSLQKYGRLRAGAGGFGYLREWIWWAGLLSMGIGESFNFVAYAFAPATLVTPLGALSILVTTILASIYLKEHINLLGKIGCLLCILGSTILVLHSPKEEGTQNMDQLLFKLGDMYFVTYLIFVTICSLCICFYIGPAYGKQNVLVYVLLCSMIGSITVISCKALGIALKQSIEGNNEMGNLLTWISLFTMILCIMVQMNYLNKALDLFNTGIVIPIYYVFFTTFVIIASTIFFQEWEEMTNEDIIGSICGFFIVNIAIFLLNAFKEVEISYTGFRQILKPKRKILNNCENGWLDHSKEEEMGYDCGNNTPLCP